MTALCAETLAEPGAFRPVPRPCHFSLVLFCIFIDCVISLGCTDGNQGGNLNSSFVLVFDLGHAAGMGVRVRSGIARAQLDVCIHDLCGLHREGGVEMTFL